MDNGELLLQANNALDKIGIGSTGAPVLKAADGLTSMENTTFGGLMPFPAVQALLELIFDQSAWISALQSFRVDGRSGFVPVMSLTGNVTEGVKEDAANPPSKRPGTTNVPYEAKPFASFRDITQANILEAKRLGIDLETRFASAFATSIRNDIADIVVNSDTTITDRTQSRNRMLCMLDGVLKKSDLGNVRDGLGKAFDRGIFTTMLDMMPSVYRTDPNLRFLYHPTVSAHLRDKLEQRNTPGSDIVFQSKLDETPAGLDRLIIPQLSANKGPAAIAPTSATDSTGYITFDLSTLVTAVHVADAASGVGRKFLATCIATGSSEVITGYLDTATLKAKTAGTLGQTTVSGTASAYTIGLYDETDILHMNPQGVAIVNCYDMESYRTFVPRPMPHWEVSVFFWMAVLIPNPACIVKIKRVGVTPVASW